MSHILVREFDNSFEFPEEYMNEDNTDVIPYVVTVSDVMDAVDVTAAAPAADVADATDAVGTTGIISTVGITDDDDECCKAGLG